MLVPSPRQVPVSRAGHFVVDYPRPTPGRPALFRLSAMFAEDYSCGFGCLSDPRTQKDSSSLTQLDSNLLVFADTRILAYSLVAFWCN